MRGATSSRAALRGATHYFGVRARLAVWRGSALAVLLTAGLALLPVASAQAAGPGTWTQAQVNTAIANGVAYLDTQQNVDGSFGNGTVAETGIALAAYGVLANGNFSSLSASYQTHVQNAIAFVLSKQNTTSPPGLGSSFGEITSLGYPTYETGLALTGLSPFKTVNAGVPTAIADGRQFLTNEFQGPAYTGCVSADPTPTTVSSTAYFCGGWNYDMGTSRSDESNSGYAMTGLEVTGGIPSSIVPDNINWNHHIELISNNPFTLAANGGSGGNDGGGAYQPAYAQSFPNFVASNANDSGTNLFSLADDGVAMSDPYVAASIKFDQDVLSSYELMQANVGPTGMSMIYHTGATEDGSCTPNAAGCDWFTSGDGGYHYSLFALTKGFGAYIPPNLSAPTNWYAKVVDLLLSQQAAAGSWPTDGRDDYSTVFATGLSVSSLGLVAVAPTITLAPNTQTLATGGSATVTATLTSGGNPVSGVTVSFKVTAGPNSGKTGSMTTNGSGQATFTYADTGGAGTDTVSSSFVDNGGVTHTSNPVSVIWQSAGDPQITAKGFSLTTHRSRVCTEVAFFSDPDTSAKPSDYSASIMWGDGTASSVGAIKAIKGGGHFEVTACHTYKQRGTYTVMTKITDVDNTSNTATPTTTIVRK